MKKCFVMVPACLSGIAATAQYNATNLALQQEGVSSGYTWKNMRIYPILAKASFIDANKNVSNYTSLEDALKQKKIRISESSYGGSVNNLVIENTSDVTVIIIGGAIIGGGKQDRMIAEDMIIPPHSGKKDLPVYCVEHGRWTPKGSRDQNGLSFNVSFDAASTKVRKAGNVAKDQGEVWEKVAEVTQKNKSTTSTGAYTSLDTNRTYLSVLSGYKTFFKAIVSHDPAIIGFVAVTGDRILGCDFFATHNLLMQQADNIIGSYATEAITDGSTVSIAYSKVKQYMGNLLTDEKKQEKMLKSNGTLLRDNNSKLHLSYY